MTETAPSRRGFGAPALEKGSPGAPFEASRRQHRGKAATTDVGVLMDGVRSRPFVQVRGIEKDRKGSQQCWTTPTALARIVLLLSRQETKQQSLRATTLDEVWVSHSASYSLFDVDSSTCTVLAGTTDYPISFTALFGYMSVSSRKPGQGYLNVNTRSEAPWAVTSYHAPNKYYTPLLYALTKCIYVSLCDLE